MDDKLQAFACVVASGSFGAVLGCLFGALAGGLYWKSGRASGTILGAEVARAFARAARTELTRVQKGALIGATDGIVFLGVCGTVAGAVLVYTGHAQWEVVRPVGLIAASLVGAAAFFGALAYAILYAGVWATAWVGLGGLSGAAVGAGAGGADGLFYGSVLGFVGGAVGAALWRRFVS
jgi:hypothetical protein